VLRALLAAALALAAPAGHAAALPANFVDPVWSPDGSAIAWENAPLLGGASSEQVWTAAPEGSGARLVAGRLDSVLQLAWPEQRTLLYDANFQLFTLGLDGTTTRIAASAGYNVSVAGGRVAWGSAGCGFCHGPVVVLTPSTGRRVSIGGVAAANADPSLSPDGTRVVFDRAVLDRRSGEYAHGLGMWVASTDGTGLRRLTALGGCPSWSPDGGRILYVARGGALRTIRPDGSGDTLLLAHAPPCSYPASFVWSPDGRTIALRDAPSGRLELLDAATRQLRDVRAFHEVTSIAWSPDSSQLLVTARPRAHACSSLWRVGADGTGARLVARCG
jgi:Tol biopolymer transport system component